jgi:hypothetical protein
MKTPHSCSWAGKLVAAFQNDGCTSARDSALDLTADEAELLEPPPRAAYEPWVVPLAIRPNDVAEDMGDD